MRRLAAFFGSAFALLAQSSLIPAGSTWRYLDNGTDQGTLWRVPGFNDSAWAQGLAQLGYGDGDEATVVGYGADANAKYVTTYFRKAFTVAAGSSLAGLTLRYRRDDGIVVYLNGVEISRDNMPAGTVSYRTLAPTAAGDDGAAWYSVNVPATNLVAGTNVIAAEIHQSAGNSSDISFDLELLGNVSVSLLRQPYLQLATPSSVVVRWRTSSATDSRVRFGLTSTNLSNTADDPISSTEHSVTLTGLSPDTTYYYSAGSTPAILAGGDAGHFFKTPPPAGGRRPARIWVLGDPGTGDANQARVRDAYYNFTGATHTDLWLMLGDNVYETGTDAEFTAKLFSVYPAMLRKSVLWPAIGNHDTAGSATPAPGIPYFASFTFPTAGQAGGVASGTKAYYSFDFGNIHFVCLDSMTSSRTAGSPMLAWLQNDLAANSKDWLIAYWHHPPYTKGSHDSDTDPISTEMRQNVLPILENHGVDLVLTGHSHAYERSYLIDGHYGSSGTFTNAMKKSAGSGTPAYVKPLGGPAAHQGAVYAVAGSSGKTGGGALNQPAMFISLNTLGSMVLDIADSRMDVKFLNDTGGIADSFSVVKGAVVNNPPSVTLTSPASNATYSAPGTVNLAANAADSDGSVQRVEFYQGSTLLGASTSAPYTMAWTNVAAGTYSLTARAFDNLGASTGSAAVLITVTPPSSSTTTLIAKGSVWRYLDNGSNQGTAWRSSGFNDSAWAAGAGQLGYGDGDEATVTGFGPDPNAKYITTYFRRTFNVATPAAISALSINLLRDDGAVVYLNGVEVMRSNMPAGALSDTTLASSAISGTEESTAYVAGTAPSSLLTSGANVVAVEIHQSAGNSSDLSFDLELTATNAAPGNLPPSAALTAPTNGQTFVAPANIVLSASASDPDGGVARVEFHRGATLLGTAAVAPYTFTWINAPAGTYSITAKAYDNIGSSATSAAVSITVNPAPPVTLAPKNSAWKYLDNGSNQGSAWTATSFNDAGWASGNGQLGYGDGDEATVVRFGPDPNAKYVTTYFRKTINVANPAAFTSLRLNLMRDDGAVVWINGVEATRSNLPAGAITFSTLAQAAIGGADESAYTGITVPASLLVAGSNVIAVEIHQSAGNSSDISFDLEVIGQP